MNHFTPKSPNRPFTHKDMKDMPTGRHSSTKFLGWKKDAAGNIQHDRNGQPIPDYAPNNRERRAMANRLSKRQSANNRKRTRARKHIQVTPDGKVINHRKQENRLGK